MADHGEDADGKIQILSFREAVRRRPTMYFGDQPPQEWPLVIAAWTAVNLLEYAAADAQQAHLTLRRNGVLCAVVRDASVTTHAGSRLSAQELVRRKMWWAELARSITVTVQRAGSEPRRTDDALLWEDVDIEVVFEPDSAMIGVAPSEWWNDGPARLRQIFTTSHPELKPGQRVTIAEEATGSVIAILGS